MMKRCCGLMRNEWMRSRKSGVGSQEVRKSGVRSQMSKQFAIAKLKIYSIFHVKYSMMKRVKVMNTIKDFPKEFELDDLIEKLVFMEKVEKGLVQLKKGKTIPHEKVKEIVKKWQK